jgi:hypothetical protein
MSLENERLKEKRQDLERRLVKALLLRTPQNEQDILDCRAEIMQLQQSLNVRWQTMANVPIKPLWLCCASGVLGAFVFRKRRLALLSRWLRSWQSDRRAEQQQLPMSMRFQNTSTTADTAMTGIQLLVFRVAGIIIDISVGIIVAWTSLKFLVYYVQKQGSFIEAFVPIPLVEGRSSFSEGSCDTIVRELRKNQAFLNQNDGVMEDSPLLKTIKAIGENCQRRRAYERYLRQEQGLADANAVVMIPSPGVPSDFPIGDGDDDNSEGHDDNDDIDHNANEFPSNVEMEDWAKSFTDDQEVVEARRKK